MTSPLVLKNFSGSPEITPEAHALKAQAIALAVPITKVETDQEQALAVNALQALKAISKGMESTRKAVKAPVLELGKMIDSIAATFLQDSDREEMRLQGLINHYQRKELERQRQEIAKRQRESAEAERLEAEAKRLREEAERTNNPELKVEVAKIEEKALDAQMSQELAPGPLAPMKPKGLVVRNRINFKVKDPHVFVQAYPQFFRWNAETETLKVDRAGILDELNKEHGIFRKTHFPEELSDSKSPELVKPPGLDVFAELKSHVR